MPEFFPLPVISSLCRAACPQTFAQKDGDPARRIVDPAAERQGVRTSPRR